MDRCPTCCAVLPRPKTCPGCGGTFYRGQGGRAGRFRWGARDVPRVGGNVLPRAGRPERCVVLLEAVRGQGQEKAAAGEGSGMKAGRDPRVGRWFWRAETEWHRRSEEDTA